MSPQAYTHNVRTHKRKVPGGGTTTVHQHQRRGGRPNPRHAWTLVGRGIRHHKRGRKWWATFWIAMGVGEATLWATFSTTGVVLGLVGGLTLGLSMLLLGRQGGNRP